MNITLNLSLEEFEKYNAYRKDAEFRETAAEKELRSLRTKHERLCDSLLKAFGYDYESIEEAEIKERGHLEDSLDLAHDWFD